MTKPIRFNIGDREIQGDDYFAVIEPVFLSVSIYDGPERYEEDLANFSTEQRLVLAYHWYLSEVNNGGHDQFYYNSTGIVWPDALKAFREFGYSEVVAIINASVSRLGGNPSLDREERQEQLEQVKPNFKDLDRSCPRRRCCISSRQPTAYAINQSLRKACNVDRDDNRYLIR